MALSVVEARPAPLSDDAAPEKRLELFQAYLGIGDETSLGAEAQNENVSRPKNILTLYSMFWERGPRGNRLIAP